MNLDIDQFRYSFFKTSITNLFRELPPSKIGLFDHMLCRYFQAGRVWVTPSSSRKLRVLVSLVGI